jgi:hypothetical protein
MNIDTQPQIIFAVVNDPSSNRYSDESKGQRTNPLIRFEPIKGLAVGFVIAYPLLTRLSRGVPFAHQTTIVSWIAYTIDHTD